MKRLLFIVIFIAILILCLFKIGYTESGQPTSTIWGWNGAEWVKLEADVTNFQMVHTSTDSDVNIYNDGNRARVIQGNADGEAATDYGLLIRSMLYGFNGATWDRLGINEMDELEIVSSTKSWTKIHDGANNAVDVEQGNASGKAATLWGLVTENMLYGFNGTAWDRLLVDLMDSLWVVTSSRSVTQARNYFWNVALGIWEEGLNDEMQNQWVRTSTNSVIRDVYDLWNIINVVASSDTTTHERLDSMFLLISTNGDATLSRLDDQFVLISTNGDAVLSRLDNQYLLISTSGDATLSRLDDQFVLISTNGDATLTRLDTIITNTQNTYEQLQSSVPVFYKVTDSTYVYRDFHNTGTLTVNFNVKAISVYSQGGVTTFDWDSGDDLTAWDGIPFDDVPIDETFDTPVIFTYTLSPPTTFSIYIRGKL